MLARNTYDRSAGLGGYTRDNAPKAVAAVPEQYALDDDDDIEEDDDPEAPTPQVSHASVGCLTHSLLVSNIYYWPCALCNPAAEPITALCICLPVRLLPSPERAFVLQSSRGALQESYLDGPASWDEVDTEELERIAVNILRSVVPSTENLEVGARLAMQVGPAQMVHLMCISWDSVPFYKLVRRDLLRSTWEKVESPEVLGTGASHMLP